MSRFTSVTKAALAGVALAGALALPLVGSSAAFAGDATFPPVANDDSYSTPQDTPLVIGAGSGLLANDLDGGNAGLGVAAVGTSPDGVLDFLADGSFTFTPNPGFVGTTHFTYHDSATGFDSNDADVAIEVTFVAKKLVGTPDFYTTPMDTVLTVSNDGLVLNDPDITWVGGIDDVTGEVTWDSHGDFTYTPAAGFVGTKTFSYYLDDLINTPSDWILVTIDVTPITSSVVPNTPSDKPDDEVATLAYTGASDVTTGLIAPAGVLVVLGAAAVWYSRRRTVIEQ